MPQGILLGTLGDHRLVFLDVILGDGIPGNGNVGLHILTVGVLQRALADENADLIGLLDRKSVV